MEISVAPRSLVLVAFVLSSAFQTHAACTGCTTFSGGVAWGTVTFNALSEASGIAASRRNYTVLWTHNDGAQGNVYAVTTNGMRLATFDLKKSVDDVEDIAVGPGPVGGVHYLYVGDIGGAVGANSERPDVKLVRLPEPLVDLAWTTNARSLDFDDVDTFTLVYPDGSYDAETLMVDPLTADVFVGTKQNGSTRIYRANVNNATNKQSVTLEFVRSVAFSEASAGDISRDGAQIILRREDAAMLWQRCDAESISSALGRTGQSVPVFGPPTEPNGEGVAFLADGTGYVTIGETNNPVLYFFQATCPRAPVFMVVPTNQSVLAGGSVQFRSAAAGYPAPAYAWRFGGQTVAGQNGPTLTLSGVTTANAGQYEVVASSSSGSAATTATLTVRAKPDLRITEVMPSQTASPGVPTGDWWELTSFESQPVLLTGWRFNDSGGGLTDPFTISNALTISPLESIVFVEGLTPAEFVNWWGATNLPAGLPIIPYGGGNLSLSANGDGIRLWDNQTASANDTVASVDFGQSTEGVSFNYDPVSQQFGGMSQVGVNGVVQAGLAADIGSPGRIRTPVEPPMAITNRLTGMLTEDHFRIVFNAIAGRVYVLEMRPDFTTSSWTPTGDEIQATSNGPVFFEKARTSGNRFYRVRVN